MEWAVVGPGGYAVDTFDTKREAMKAMERIKRQEQAGALTNYPSTTTMERLQRITGFLARIWNGMSQPQRNWAMIMAGLAVFGFFIMWRLGPSTPSGPPVRTAATRT